MRTSILIAAVMLPLLCLALPSAEGQSGSWGTIKGRIVWDGGEVPRRELINMGGNANAAQCMKNGKPPLTETWVVDPKNKGIRWTFVWLAADKGKTLPIHPNLKALKNPSESMDQPWCMFEPHALAMREGQVLVAKNTAQIAHNFRGAGHPAVNPGFNLIIPPGGSHKIESLLADRLPIVIQCDIHPWMKAHVRVFDHPYYAVTDENGAFEIKDAPAGKWNLMIWHDTGWRGGPAGSKGTPVAIKSGTTDLGDLLFAPNK